jgi:hypothetical protein
MKITYVVMKIDVANMSDDDMVKRWKLKPSTVFYICKKHITVAKVCPVFQMNSEMSYFFRP